MDPKDLDNLEQEQLHDTAQTPPFDAGGTGREPGVEPDSDRQFTDTSADHPSKDDAVDETQFYNEGDGSDNPDADEPDVPDIDSHLDPAKQ